jgi:hypothetical protein
MAKKNKKPKMVMVISVKPPGGKAPKKPTETADVDKAGRCGVKKSKAAVCSDCGKEMNFSDTGRRETCIRCGIVAQFGEDSPEVAEDDAMGGTKIGVKKELNQCPQCGGPAGPRGCRRRCSFGPAERFVLQGSNNLNQHQRDMLREG